MSVCLSVSDISAIDFRSTSVEPSFLKYRTDSFGKKSFLEQPENVAETIKVSVAGHNSQNNKQITIHITIKLDLLQTIRAKMQTKYSYRYFVSCKND